MKKKKQYWFTYFMVAIAFILLPISSVFAETYTYDELNRLQSVTYEDGQTIEYTYDDVGNVVSTTTTGNKVEEEPGKDKESEDEKDDEEPVKDKESEDKKDDEEKDDEEKDGQDSSEKEEGTKPEEEAGSIEDVSTEEKDGQLEEGTETVTETASGNDGGNGLPSTATSIFNILLVGSLLLIIGVVTYLYKKKKSTT